MHYLIYKITNRLDNKFYVGKHKTENKDDGYFGSGLLLARAVQKHGKENFNKEILFELATEDEMNQKEADIVDDDFIARDDTYNIMLGGNGGFDYINRIGGKLKRRDREMCRIAAEKTNEVVKDKMQDEEYRREYRIKRSLGAKRYQSLYGNPFEGHRHDEETRKKMSNSMKGKNLGTKNGVYGKHWVTNGTDSKMVDKNTITDGWRKGRV